MSAFLESVKKHRIYSTHIQTHKKLSNDGLTHVCDVAQPLKQAEILGPNPYPVEGEPSTKSLAHRAQPERRRLLSPAVRAHVSRLE